MNPTLAGVAAILMWAMLALLTKVSGQMPPFQLLAVTMLIGGSVGVAIFLLRGLRVSRLRLSAMVWVTGIGGLFFYHFFYYTALRNAPAAPASLIAYLWPMLIVAGSALLPGERLLPRHVAGVLLGFSGSALLLWGGDWQSVPGNAALGFASAFACALIWSSYSILSRSQRSASSDAVAIYCLASAVLASICHLALEETVWPNDGLEWAAIAGLGLMPVGLAFYAWDHGVKNGDIQFLGSAAYLSPLLSTFILVVSGIAYPDWRLVVACVAIVAGAIIASGQFRRSSIRGAAK